LLDFNAVGIWREITPGSQAVSSVISILNAQCLTQLIEHILIAHDLPEPLVQGHLGPSDRTLEQIGNRVLRFKPFQICRKDR
jgi:hypothetical protein